MIFIILRYEWITKVAAISDNPLDLAFKLVIYLSKTISNAYKMKPSKTIQSKPRN